MPQKEGREVSERLDKYLPNLHKKKRKYIDMNNLSRRIMSQQSSEPAVVPVIGELA